MAKFVSALFTCLVFIFSTTVAQIVYAQPISTADFINYNSKRAAHERLKLVLDRPQIVALVSAQGVSIEESKKRVDALTGEEVDFLLKNFDEIEAGADGVGTVVGAILLVFFVLLLTDILGLTKVFPFTRSIN